MSDLRPGTPAQSAMGLCLRLNSLWLLRGSNGVRRWPAHCTDMHRLPHTDHRQGPVHLGMRVPCQHPGSVMHSATRVATNRHQVAAHLGLTVPSSSLPARGGGRPSITVCSIMLDVRRSQCLNPAPLSRGSWV